MDVNDIYILDLHMSLLLSRQPLLLLFAILVRVCVICSVSSRSGVSESVCLGRKDGS